VPGTLQRITLAPHCSLTPRGAWIFFATVSAGTLAVAGLVAAQGFWPVLPFAGAELALLAWALATSMRRRHERQTVVVSDDAIVVAEGFDEVPSARFARHWARVTVRRAASTMHPSRLLIESRGRSYEVGRFLTEEERHRTARQLAALIGRMNETPALSARELSAS
jgi:uncharacterized membrane protein